VVEGKKGDSKPRNQDKAQAEKKKESKSALSNLGTRSHASSKNVFDSSSYGRRAEMTSHMKGKKGGVPRPSREKQRGKKREKLLLKTVEMLRC